MEVVLKEFLKHWIIIEVYGIMKASGIQDDFGLNMIYAITLSLIRKIVIRENDVDTRGERKNGIIYREDTDDYRRNGFFWKRSSEPVPEDGYWRDQNFLQR